MSFAGRMNWLLFGGGDKEWDKALSFIADRLEDLEKLRALLVRLQKLTRELKAEISSIRGSFPYTMKELLENEDLLLEKREALLAELSDIREANRQLDRLIELIRAEMGHG